MLQRVVLVLLVSLSLALSLPAAVLRDLHILQRDISSLRSHRDHAPQALLHIASREGVAGPQIVDGMKEFVIKPSSGPEISVVLLLKNGLENKVFWDDMMVWKPTYKAIPADDREFQDKMLSLARSWLATWTSGEPGKLLKRIFIADAVYLASSEFAGFYSAAGRGDTLFMAKSTIDRDEWFSTLYHEHAHLVHGRTCNSEDPNNEWNKKWLALLPADFRWRGQCGAECSRDVNTSLFSKGFLTGYNTVSLSEDVAQFANALWMGTLQVWDCAKENDICDKKIDLIVELYKKLDSGFNRDFFDGRKTIRRYFVSNEFDSRKPPVGLDLNVLKIGDTATA